MNQNSKRYEVLAEIRKDPHASYQELMERTYLHTVSAVAYHVDRLIAEGLLRKEPRLARSLEVCSPSTSFRAKVIDQRKRNSAKTCEKKQAVGQQGRGTSATIAKQRTARKLKEWERIEMVVRMAMAGSGDPSQTKDVVKGHRGYTSLHAVRVG